MNIGFPLPGLVGGVFPLSLDDLNVSPLGVPFRDARHIRNFSEKKLRFRALGAPIAKILVGPLN